MSSLSPCNRIRIRIPESGNFFFVETWILGFGIRNPTNEYNPESKFHWQLESGIPYLESGIRNLGRGIQNPRLSWIPLLVYLVIKSFHSNLGLHAAAHDLDIPWIIIKGISDYKDGRKSGTDCWKKFASLMAASLTVHILSDRMVFRDWPHYTETNKYYNKLSATGRCHLFWPP